MVPSNYQLQGHTVTPTIATNGCSREQSARGNVNPVVIPFSHQMIGCTSFDVIPYDERNLKLRKYAEEIAEAQQEAELKRFIESKKKPVKTNFPTYDLITNLGNTLLSPLTKYSKSFYAKNVVGRLAITGRPVDELYEEVAVVKDEKISAEDYAEYLIKQKKYTIAKIREIGGRKGESEEKVGRGRGG